MILKHSLVVSFIALALSGCSSAPAAAGRFGPSGRALEQGLSSPYLDEDVTQGIQSGGTTFGMMLANVPAVLLGDVAAKKLPLALVRAVAALIGSSPLLAIKYQLVVVFMQAAATALASLVFVRLAAGRYLTPAHQLRRYLL